MLPDSLNWLLLTFMGCLSSDRVSKLAQFLPNLKLEKNGLLFGLVCDLICSSSCVIFLRASINYGAQPVSLPLELVSPSYDIFYCVSRLLLFGGVDVITSASGPS